MTIETGPAQSTGSRPATETSSVKGKASDTHGHGRKGFTAILASLGVADTATAGAGKVADTSTASMASSLAALSRNLGGQKTSHVSDPATTSGPDGDADTALLEEALSKAPKVGVDGAVGLAVPATDTTVQIDPQVDASALLALAAHWNVAPTATGADPQTPADAATAPANLAGSGKLPRVQSGLDLGTAGPATGADAALELPTKTLSTQTFNAQKDVFARLAAAQAALTPATTPAGNSATEARQTQLEQKVAEVSVTAAATTLAPATTLASPRREEFSRERSVFRANANDASSSVSQSYTPSGTGSAGLNAPDPVTPTDTFIAEKVAYWISNDVQNAEMKLDGIGDNPVEVSIRMHGNEAHIAFRSDELQARAALENASLHLKDMLQREGLVLSGVSVGTSGAGDSGDQERKPRQGVRQSGVASVQAARVERSSGGGRGVGGGLDLFV